MNGFGMAMFDDGMWHDEMWGDDTHYVRCFIIRRRLAIRRRSVMRLSGYTVCSTVLALEQCIAGAVAGLAHKVHIVTECTAIIKCDGRHG